MGKTIADIPKYVVELPPPPPKEYKFSCGDCDKQFTKLSRLKMHQVTHLSEKPFKCSFEGCKSSYYRKNHLKRHEATRHLVMGGDYKCEVDGCFASFETSSSLYFHNKRRHSEKKFSCPLCSEKFSKKYQLKEHEQDHNETEIVTFKCGDNECKEEFRSHTLLKSHQKLHRKRRVAGEEKVPRKNTYPCAKCDSVFEKWSSYLAHRKAVHRVMVECATCNQMISQAHYRMHVKIHEDKKLSFPCPHENCPKAYQYTQNLAHHIKVSHEGRGFVCHVCNRKLSTKQKLDHHVNIVHDNPPPPMPKIAKEEIFSRKQFVDMLSCEVDFEVIRRGPPKGKTLPQDNEYDDNLICTEPKGVLEFDNRNCNDSILYPDSSSELMSL